MWNQSVVVEKPFTPTYQEAQKLIDLAKKQSRLLTVYQSMLLLLTHLLHRGGRFVGKT